MKKESVTPEMLRDLLEFTAATGALTWRRRTKKWIPDDRIRNGWNTRHCGRLAFTSVYPNGYLKGSISGVTLLAHRVAWAVHYGEWPRFQIDHINGDRTDNRLMNLRDVPRAVNMKNCKAPSNNTSGAVGVCWDKSRNKWLAFINVDRRLKNLGRFAKKSEAVAIRKEAEKALGFHPNHGRKQ